MKEYPPERPMSLNWLFFLPILIPLGFGAYFLWIYFVIHAQYSAPVPGNLRAFDPITSFGDVQAFAGDGLRFRSLEAEYVSPDGTLDFGASYTPPPHATYIFLQPTTVENAAPVGAGGSATGKWMNAIEVTLGKKGRYAEVSYDSKMHVDSDFRSRGMDKDIGYPQPDGGEATVPPPVCSFANLWKVAIEKGAPTNAVAKINYDKDGYEFQISTASVYLEFNTSCQLTRNNYEPVELIRPE